MKAYIATTGVLFLMIAGAHMVRVSSERHLARDPWFIATTIIALALVVWAARLLRAVRADHPTA
jgi:hypothetical protein